MKFVLDTMLGHLLTWLRLLGYDTIYAGDVDDDELLSLSLKENRVLVTRDRKLAAKSAKNGIKAVLLENVEVVECLLKIAEQTGINLQFRPENSRCPACNEILVKAEDVPTRWKCPGCLKEYWVGRHWKNIKKVLDILEEKSFGR
ncbi:MAG: Mut7-C RNAse domain-containing protein [Candidatus Caldarchaeum sp.]